MRAIDHMTPEELVPPKRRDKVKGMLAMRHTPYASNEGEAKDYELDRLEHEEEIMDSEQLKHMKRMLEHARRVLAEKHNNPPND